MKQKYITKVNKVSLGERAKKSLEEDILNRMYYPNQRLIEKEIALKYRLSRGPVREALRHLEAKGVVTRSSSR